MSLEALERAAAEVCRMAVPEEQTADTSGRIRKVERDLGTFRLGLMREVGAQRGENYAVTETREATRTYNLPAILKSVMTALDCGPWEALRQMRDAGAVKLEVTWKPKVGQGLSQFFAARHIGLRLGTVDDATAESPDGPHVGEHWDTKLELEGRTG